MKYVLAAIALICATHSAAFASDSCSKVKGNVVLSARTPQVDLYDNADGRNRVMSLDKGKFPNCTPVIARAPNMMLQVTLNNTPYWIPPHMVNTRIAGKRPSICRNLAMGSDQAKVGSTRALGEDCPKPKSSGQ